MRKVSIVKVEGRFQITIYTRRNTLLGMIDWLKQNFPHNDHKKSIRLRRESRIVARRFKRKPRPYLVLFLSKDVFMKFGKEWLAFDK